MVKSKEDNILKLKRCDLSKCEAMCCYDGVYLADHEEKKIKSVVNSYPDFFSFLPDVYITLGLWEGRVEGLKTEVRPFEYKNKDFPKHFNRTRCVFSLDDGKCSLQTLAVKMNMHHWSFKPKSCWRHPLSVIKGKLSSPPIDPIKDIYNLGEKYSGYTCYTICGKHQEDGDPWYKTLDKEIKHFNSLSD